uniref:KIB1-4 beta-propeller domain-containing protein n=1 Tax=Oryza meridionalis TaxID=40149 RepID=A0A0E0EDJ3_9ORYZ
MDKPAATRRGAKRSRTHDACWCCSSSSTQIPLRRGAKRRSVSHLRRCAPAPPLSWCSWGAKRARTGTALGPPPPRPKLSSDRIPLFESESVDWANLGEGPAGLIAERVLANDVADYIRFRSVCQPWRRCCAAPPADDALDRRFHPRQWFILPEKSRIRYHCRLLNLSTGECILAHLPEFRGHRVFSPSTEGLVLLLHESTHVARLLNALTHQLTDLPPVTALLDLLLPLVDLSVDGFGLADDRTVVIHNTVFLAVAKPGDRCWTAVNLSDCLRPSMSFAGRFYGVASDAIMVVEVSRESQTPQLVEAAMREENEDNLNYRLII